MRKKVMYFLATMFVFSFSKMSTNEESNTEKFIEFQDDPRSTSKIKCTGSCLSCLCSKNSNFLPKVLDSQTETDYELINFLEEDQLSV